MLVKFLDLLPNRPNSLPFLVDNFLLVQLVPLNSPCLCKKSNIPPYLTKFLKLLFFDSISTIPFIIPPKTFIRFQGTTDPYTGENVATNIKSRGAFVKKNAGLLPVAIVLTNPDNEAIATFSFTLLFFHIPFTLSLNASKNDSSIISICLTPFL